ncbi:selenium metabolism-associated LysR family transcriptional regulator [Desulfitobacterium sp.]|uniref:selenium metabolism-associated LysR family transcriptional regulator n=1 Tax=Desulfitobacterium sp. TaxID=49981 RepID=UPI002BB65446|nr:selenium metabolism-associated LysR family transcriptional regulator [Desulfitobacterium sp.]HVJ48686.1 selenium metabolism-associated LysR family transcriptional regulator [Desulfitobacterium sp.]
MLDLMRIFVQVVEEGSYTLVAHHLGVSQPAISNHMRSLEDKLGVKLFQRHGKGFILTQEGEVFYLHAQRILEEWNRLKEHLEENCAEVSGKVHIGASHIPGEYLLPYTLGPFQKDYPKISFKLSIGDSLEMADKVLSQEVDFAVIGSNFKTDKLNSVFWMPDQIKLVFTKDHPLNQLEVIQAADLNNYAMVIRENGSGHRRAVEDALINLNLHLEDFRISLEAGSTEAVKNAIRGGLGYSFISISALQPDDDALVARDVAGLEIERGFYLITRRNKLLTKPTQLCYDFLTGSTIEKQILRE